LQKLAKLPKLTAGPFVVGFDEIFLLGFQGLLLQVVRECMTCVGKTSPSHDENGTGPV